MRKQLVRERANQFFSSAGFVVTGMGGNTSGWKNSLGADSLQNDITITDGDYRAPTSWAHRCSVGVVLLGRNAEVYASFGREFETVSLFRRWYDSEEAAFFRSRGIRLNPSDLIHAGFTKED